MSLVSRPGQHTIGVYVGWKAGVQLGPFKEAMIRLGIHYVDAYGIVYIDITLVKK